MRLPSVALLLLATSFAATARGDDPKLREHAEDVADYTLSAELDPVVHTVKGEGTIRFRNTSTVAIREVWLHLYLNGFKNEQSRFMREASDGRGSGRPREWGGISLTKLELEGGAGGDLLPHVELSRPGDSDETDARVPLPREVPPGEIFELRVEWLSRLPSIVERTGFSGSFHMVGQWFPKVARLEKDGTWAHFPFHHLGEFYSDFGTYDVTISVPAGYVIGATGPVLETRSENGRTFERHLQGDVHDFAFAAWDHFTSSVFDVDGVKVTMLAPAHHEYAVGREAEAVKFGLRYFGEKYGAYPYKTLTVVHPPPTAEESGGMEYPTLVTTGGPWFGPPLLHVTEVVTLHELGHQWFYGLLASNEDRSPWLDEGFNSFAEEDSLRALLGPGSFASVLGFTLSDDALFAVYSNRAAAHHPVAAPAASFVSAADYGALAYERTATLLETLLRVYGPPLREAIGAYARTNRFLHPTPDDALLTIRTYLGERAELAAKSALFDKGWVDYEVVSVRAVTGLGSADLSENSYEVIVRRMGTISLPCDVKFLFSDGSSEMVAWSAEADEERLAYHGPKTMTGAVIDPDDKLLLDQNRANNQKSVASGAGRGASMSIEWLVYWAAVLFRFVTR